MAFEVGSAIARIKADLTDFKAGIAEAKTQTSGLGETLGNIRNGINDFAQKASIMSAVAAGSLALLGRNALVSAQTFQEARLAFNNMIGDGQKAAELMQQLSDEALKSAFTLPQVIEGGKQLLAYGFQVGDIVDELDRMGNVAYGVKAPLGDIVYLFGTLNAQGRAYTRDIVQFTQRGIPMWDELSKVMGVSVSEVQSLVEHGEVGFPQVQKALHNLTDEGGRFHNAMNQPTLALTISNISDSFTRMGAAFMGVSLTGDVAKGSLFEKISMAANALLGFVSTNGPAISKFGTDLGNVISNIFNALKPIGEWMVTNQKVVIPFFQGLAVAIGAVLLVAPILVIVLNPFLLIFAAIAISVGLLYAAWQNNFLGIQTITKAVLGFLLPYIQSWWAEISLAFQFYWNLITAIWNAGSAVINYNWGQLWENVKSIFTNAWNFIKGIFNSAFGFISDWAGRVLQALVQPFEDAWHRITDLVNKIKSALDFTQRHSPSVVDVVENGVALVNSALNKLELNANVTPYQVAGIGNGVLAGGPMAVGGSTILQISLDGAIIADDYSAARMAEKVGNSIIKKLQQNVKF